MRPARRRRGVRRRRARLPRRNVPARPLLTRVVVISDTHLPRGARVLPPRAVELCRSADLILHGGDITSLAFWDELRALGPPVEGVLGNMDEPALADLLPKERVVEVDGARIGMVHIPGPAAGRAERLRRRFPDADAIVYGHTHVPEVAEHDGAWILNPGSPTERRRARVHTLVELEIGSGKPKPRLVELT